MANPDASDRSVREPPDLADLAARAASDPSVRAFVEAVKAGLADGSIHEELARQPDFHRLIEEHYRQVSDPEAPDSPP